MNSSAFKPQQFHMLTALLVCSAACFQVWAQSSPQAESGKVPLNLDDRSIAKELVKEEPAVDQTEKISAGPNRMDESFSKAERHRVLPTTKEISVAGAPERVTKVTGADGASYCVYSPTVARTDGIDQIQNGVQNQVRTCPQ